MYTEQTLKTAKPKKTRTPTCINCSQAAQALSVDRILSQVYHTTKWIQIQLVMPSLCSTLFNSYYGINFSTWWKNPQRVQIILGHLTFMHEALGSIPGSREETYYLNWDKYILLQALNNRSCKTYSNIVWHLLFTSRNGRHWPFFFFLPFQYNVLSRSNFLFYYHHDHLQEQLLCIDKSQHIKNISRKKVNENSWQCTDKRSDIH